MIKFNKDTGIEAFPWLIRRETGLMEFVCKHGVGHPARDSIRFFENNGVSSLGVHGCDGCCQREDFPDIKYIPARLEIVYK